MQTQRHRDSYSFILKGFTIPLFIFGIFFGGISWAPLADAATPTNEIGPTGEDPLIREFFQTVFGESTPDFSDPSLKIVPAVIPSEGIKTGNIENGTIKGEDIASRTLSEDKIAGCTGASELFVWDGDNWNCTSTTTIGLQQVSTSSDGYFTGLGTNASPLSINPSKVQRRVNGSCNAGTFLQSVGEDGSPTCAAPTDGDTDPTNEIQGAKIGGGIERDADNNFGLLSNCASGELLQWRDNGSGVNTWQCTPKNFVNFWQQNNTNISYTGGNVGIGTSTPTSALHVEGVAQFGSNPFLYIGKSGSVQTAPDVQFDLQGFMAAESNLHLYIDSDNNQTDAFLSIGANSSKVGIGDTVLFTVKENGNVGIGSSNPGSKLHLSGNGGQTLLIKPTTMSFGDISSIKFSDSDNGTGPMSINYKDDGTADLNIDGGNVGIGVIDPTEKLDVNGTIRATDFVKADGSPIGVWGKNGTKIYYNDGNVGIGTNNPASKLQVSGEIVAQNGFGERLYLGGDSANHDLEIGTLDAGVTGIAFWSRATSDHMHIAAKNGSFSGTITATNLSGNNTGDQGIIENYGLQKNGSNNFGLIGTCGNGQLLKWNGTIWSCQNDDGITSELDPTVKAFAKANLPNCPTGQVLVGDGTNLSCVADKLRSESEIEGFINNNNFDMGTHTITVPNPISANNVANKGYVDSLITGLSWKDPVNAGVNPNGTDSFGTHGICNTTKKTWTTYNKDNDMIYTCNGSAWVALSTSVGTPNATDTVPGKIQITGDLSGNYDSPQIKAGAIVNADINASAAIAGSKIAPNFGSQNIITTGKIGVGDTTPDSDLKIDVEGKIGATQYCDQNGANCIASSNLDVWRKNASDSTKLYYNNGYIGIGTDTPTERLHIVNGNIKADAFILTNGTPLSGPWQINNTTKAAFYDFNDGNASHGFVGIGTANPTTKLHVVGTIKATDFVKEDGTSLTSTWSRNGDNTYYNVGKVGIGTSTPETSLQILGTAGKSKIAINSGDTTNPELILDNDSNIANNNHWSIYGDNASGSLRFAKSGTDKFRFASDGKMGVGLASGDSIAANLHAVGTTGEQLRLQNSTNYAGFSMNGTNALNIQVNGGSDSQVIIGNATNQNNLLLFNGDVEKYHIALDATDDVLKIGKGETVGDPSKTFLTVNGNGNVGIKTSIPSTALDIGGDSLRLRLAKTPASATESCLQGTIAWDADALYICVAENQWKKSALTTW